MGNALRPEGLGAIFWGAHNALGVQMRKSITVSLSEELIAVVDQKAEEQGLNRSRVLEQLIREGDGRGVASDVLELLRLAEMAGARGESLKKYLRNLAQAEGSGS